MEIKELMQFIKEYNQRLSEKYGSSKDKEKSILRSALKIGEEFGELCDEVMAYHAIQRDSKMENRDEDGLANEFADVLIAVCMLADDMDVDLEKALEKKIKKIRERAL